MANAGVGGRPIAPLVLSAQERAYLERQVRRHRVARSLSERCRAILRCADGLPSKSVAAELGIHEHTVGKWRRRFLKDRCDGLLDEARPGRPRTINDDQVAAKIKAWLARRPHYHVHFTPTSASWINQIERWFAELTRKQIQRGVHTSVSQLEADIRTFHRPAQQKPEALQMDQVRRPDFGFRQTLLPQSPADFMWRTFNST